MLDLMPRMSAEGARGPLGLGRAAILGTSAIFFATASVAPAAAAEVDELKSEMRQLLDRIDRIDQNQQRTQIEVDQIEANSAWLVNEAPVRARASVITPANAQGDYVSGGDFPGSFKLPGSDLSMAISGFIRANYIYDFGPLQGAAVGTALPTLLPTRGAVGATNTGQTNFEFRSSVFQIETRTPSEYGSINTLMQFEQAVALPDGGGNSSTINEVAVGTKLIQASIGPWTVGMHWTAFTNLAQYAEMATFENINTGTICRCPALSYADSLGGGWSIHLSIVDPVTQIDLAGSGFGGALIQNNTGMPDLQGRLTYTQDWGNIALSGQVRQVSYTIDDAVGTGDGFRTATGKSSDSLTGWGFTAGISVNNPLGLHPRDRFFTQFTYGEAMRGIVDFSLLSAANEGVVNPITGNIDASTQAAFTAHYQHWWTETVRSSIGYSVGRVSPGNDFDAQGSIRRSTLGFVNLFWSPVPRVNLGIEGLYLDKKVKSTSGFGTLDGNDNFRVEATALILW